MARLWKTLGWVLLIGGLGLPGPSAAQGDGRSAMEAHVREAVRRAAPEAPAPSTLRRLQKYDRYIQYFAGLAYTRRGVNVSVNFVRALIAAESAARPTAVSSEEAIGLLQIQLDTGRRAARALYATGYDFRFVDRSQLHSLSRRDLKDPAVNILIGCYLLDRYNAAFGDHLARTVGAWNAGPDRIRQYGGTPPYRETVGLIARVNAFYLFFRKRGPR